MDTRIPQRADTLQVLRLLGNGQPLMMLAGTEDGFGERWTVAGQEIPPAIPRYLLEAGYIAETGRTELGARRHGLTDAGSELRERGIRWWESLGWLEKLKVTLFG